MKSNAHEPQVPGRKRELVQVSRASWKLVEALCHSDLSDATEAGTGKRQKRCWPVPLAKARFASPGGRNDTPFER